MIRKRLPELEIPAATFLYLAFLLLVLPIRWVLGMAAAAAIHEAGHLVALMLLQIPIVKIRVGVSGAQIETGQMHRGQELICAIAGPAVGALTVLLARKFPVIALCGLLQSLYNLIPIYPSDGARVLQCLLPAHNAESVCWVASECCLVVLGFLGILLMRYETLGVVPIAGVIFLVVKSGFMKNTLQRLL